MQERQTSRMPFDPHQPISKLDLLQVLEAGRWAPTAHNMQNFEIVVVDDRKSLDYIRNIKRPVSETFVRENYKQLSLSEEELLIKKTGLLSTMFPPSWLNPDFTLDIHDTTTGSSLQRPLPPCPVMLIVVYDPTQRAPASEGDFLGNLSLGCAMENMWLMANSLGIAFHIISSLSTGTTAKEVKEFLGIPLHLNIAFCCRLGYPQDAPLRYLRVRRDIKDFTHHNKFGFKGL